MISKFLTLVWYLRQPKLYPHLIYQLQQLFFPNPLERTREEAINWCTPRSISTADALELIIGKAENRKLSEIYPEFFDRANKLINKLPVQMGGGADLELLYFLSKNQEATTIVETGVASGWSSLTFLLSLRNQENGHLYSADIPYAKLKNEDFVGCVIPDELKSRWSLLRLPDRQALRKIKEKVSEIDVFHYDSDKSYRGRMWAYPYVWKMIKKGGIFISDDISDNIAFKNFAETLKISPIIIYNKPENKFIGILVKDY